MEFVGGVTINHTIRPFKRQLNYVTHYGTNLKNLKKKVDELSTARVEVGTFVERDKKMGKTICPTVEKWMETVDPIIKEANILLEEDCKAKAKANFIFVPSYQRSKNATKLAESVIELLEQKEKFPDSVSFDAPPQERWSIPTKDYEPLGSRLSLVEQILNEFENGDMSIIGVYGISGVGKTTFAKDVFREAKKHALFDDVVLILDVRENQNLEEHQKTIAQSLRLKLMEDETLDKRANRLFDRMKDKNVLVILDDVWEEIDLEKVGVHSGVCKILLTSRSRQVFLSPRMSTQKEVCLETLNEEETWRLFEKTVGDVVQDSKIKSEAIKVANRCGGLPVLVVTVAAALKNQNNIHVWKDVCRVLKNPGDNEEFMLQKAYSGIEWSYNQLDDDNTKKLFLFCCALAIRSHFLSDLLKYCFGMGLFSNNIHTVEQVRNKLHRLVDKLKGSCLFLNDGSEQIRLHDLVREVGIKIIKGRDESILTMQRAKEFKGLSDNDFLKNCTMIDLNFIDVPLFERLECPNLEFFSICMVSKVRDFLFQIPSNFFKGMTALKVLDLTGFNMLLPSSFVDLTNLKTLCLDGSVLVDISIVGHLRNLQILSFLESKFLELPKEIGQLTHLKLLDLSYCSHLQVIPRNVLSSLTSLEELKMRESFIRWETEGNASLFELKNLSNLATLEIHIPNASLLPVDLFSCKLKNFKILIGDTWDWRDVSNETSDNVLKLKLVGSSQLDKGLKRLLKKTKSLYLDEMEGVDNISSQLDNEGFQGLNHLYIQNNPQIRYVSNNSNISAFLILESLVLQNLSSIEYLCFGQFTFEPFKRLTSIEVNNCPNLKTLFSFSIAKCLSQLKKLKAVNCDIIEELFNGEVLLPRLETLIVSNCVALKFLLSSSMASSMVQLKYLEITKCQTLTEIVSLNQGDCKENELFGKLNSIRLDDLPKLVSFSSTNEYSNFQTGHAPHYSLFDGMVLLPSLETLYLRSITSNILWGDLRLSTSSLGWVQNLKTLEVSDCVGLKFLLSSSMARSMVQLKHLEVRNCETLTEIVSLNQGDCAVIKEVELFGKLEYMSLIDLPNLVSFSSTNQYNNFQTGLSPHYPLFDGMVQFPILMGLVVSGLNKVTTIWHNKLPSNSFCGRKEVKTRHCTGFEVIVKQHHAFPSNQNSIYIKRCPNLKSVLPATLAGSLQGLEQLVIEHCGALEEILKKEEQETNQHIMFEFPKVKCMGFFDLPELKSFYGGMHSSKWPSLTRLEVLLGRNNNKVQILAKEHSSFQEKRKTDNPCDPMKQPLFLIEKESFSNLKKLTLSAAIEVYDDPITAACLSRVKDVKVFPVYGVDISSIFLSNCFRYFHSSFEGLTLQADYGNDNHGQGSIAEHTFGTLSHLKALRVHSMNCLTHLWKDNSQPGSAVLPVLPNLEFLDVSYCSRLKSIVSSAISFCNLTHLIVKGCNKLKYLVTYQVAKSLTQLKIMSVECCKGMVVIVESNDGDDDDGYNINNIKIVFGKLLCLKLKSLPSLRSFCSKNDHCCIKVPSLKTLMVNDRNFELKISEEGELLQHEFNSLINETMLERHIGYGINFVIDHDETLCEYSERLLAMC